MTDDNVGIYHQHPTKVTQGMPYSTCKQQNNIYVLPPPQKTAKQNKYKN